MKYAFLLLAGWFLAAQSCSNAQCPTSEKPLPAAEFSQRLGQCPEGVLLDVRTPEEFEKGHLPNARNVDWDGDNFMAEANKMDMAKPVFVYCLSGGRSHSAASKLRKMGFKNVLELEGGIMKWRAAQLPEVKGGPANVAGMSEADFRAQLQTDKLVLVDFYADWCAPCKRIAPYLAEIKQEMAEKVVVLRINADENEALAQSLKIEGLPTLLIYKNGAEQWRNMGFLEKSAVVAKLGEF